VEAIVKSGWILAHGEPAGGAPVQDLVPAAIIAAIGVGVLVVIGRAHRAGRARWVAQVAGWTGSIPGLRGLPAWASAPIGLSTVSLLTAVFGFYWDVSTHIDNGRDPGPFANPAHFFILAGLAGIAVAGYVAVILGVGDEHPGPVAVRTGWRVPVGGVLLLACGVIALAGFPLDDVWHRIFGQDVTLWGPTHVQMVAGASLATLAMWVLYLEGVRVRPDAHRRGVELSIAAAFLIGLATLQAEFDFGVPQFRLLYQPVLLALAAGLGLVAARVRTGRGGALAAAAGFVILRGGLALLIGPVLGRSVPHFPLFVAEALAVEAVALVVSTRRPVAFGALAGLAIGTVGLGGEWAWSHVWMPLPWPGSMMGEALVWAALAGTAGGVLGGLIGRALAGGPVAEHAVPRWAGAIAGAIAVLAIAWPMPTSGGNGLRADVSLRDLPGSPRHVAATIRLHPEDGADGAAFFNITAWQGADWRREHVVIDDLDEVAPGVWRTSRPIPVYGEWKAIVRLQKGRTLASLPVFMPADEAIPAKEIPADASFTRTFVRDKQLLQREFTGGPGWLQGVAYGTLAAVAIGWVWLVAWGLGRLLATDRRTVVDVTDRATKVRVAG
jgi:hypothetical protein